MLALVVHELATNSLKYGAFSAAGGQARRLLPFAQGAEVVVVWSERGGPYVRISDRDRGGMEAKLVDRSVRGHLGGSIDRELVL